ncbi:Peptidase C48, SUMO/Sentrin/Ubl1 [Corchorus olitorius]|uniref:Peptidase C48, SUMO/Sentrin/Ubl1 n=1 Tax=Corchorus olitorius TaxID=93759 RepID=A0A1R3JF72_9ROSI|nr:Peptidase C48, SUMO/Sentrin/Ubl1 [Corchorus olitorius]
MGDTLSRFNIPGNKNIKVYDLEDCIHKAEATSLEFKAKFILFAIGCLLCPRSGTYIDKSYYSCLTEDMFKGRVDWATHVYTVLMNGIADFKSQKANAYVTGCIMILQVIYADVVSGDRIGRAGERPSRILCQVEVKECEQEDFQNIHDAMKNSWIVNSPGLDEQEESPKSKSSKEMDLDGDDHDFEGPTMNEKIHCCEEIQALKCEVISTNEKVDLTNEKVDLVQGLLSSFGDEIGWIKRQLMLLVEQRNLEARMNMGGRAGSVRDECDKRVPKSNGNGLGSDERGAPDLGVRSFRGFKSGEKRSSSVRRPQKKNTNGNSVGKIKRKLYFGPDCRERCRKNGTPGSSSSKINVGNSKEGSAHHPFIVEPDIHNKGSTDGETDSTRSGGSIKFNHVYSLATTIVRYNDFAWASLQHMTSLRPKNWVLDQLTVAGTYECNHQSKIEASTDFYELKNWFIRHGAQAVAISHAEGVPQQTNGDDCGVFTMKFMMSRNDLPYMDVRCDNDERYRLAGMLANSSLNHERPTVMGVLSTAGLI